MLKDRIIDLENGSSLYIINDIEYEGRIYIMASKVDTEKDEIDEEEVIIKEIIPDGDDLETKSVPNELLETITKLLLEKEISE